MSKYHESIERRMVDVMRDGDWHPTDEIFYLAGGNAGNLIHCIDNVNKNKPNGYTIEKKKDANNLYFYRLLLHGVGKD